MSGFIVDLAFGLLPGPDDNGEAIEDDQQSHQNKDGGSGGDTKFFFGLSDPVKDLEGENGVPVVEAVGRESNKPDGTNDDEGGGFSDCAGGGENDSG